MQSQKSIIVVLLAFVFAMPMMAQEHLTGVVMSGKNTPIVGASVTVDGTTLSTITDEEGRFELSAPADAILIISYPGYTTQHASAASLNYNGEMRIVLARARREMTAGEPRPHRVAVWADGGALCLPGSFKYPNQSSDYVSMAGEVGVGYQLYYKHFIFTTGLEVLLSNYKDKVQLDSQSIGYRMRQYKLQVPLWFGMEYPWWYFQAGAKVGFADFYSMDIGDDHANSTLFAFSVAPTFEIGTNIYSLSSGACCKIGVFAQPYFEQPIMASDGTIPADTRIAFSKLLAGLKFTVTY